MNGATLVVLRPAEGFRDLVRAYQIRVDGRRVGHVKRGQQQVIELSPGEHEVRMHLDWCSSPALRVHIADGEVVTLRTQPNLDGSPALWAITFGRARYITLERVDV
jgi:hypothetical protein